VQPAAKLDGGDKPDGDDQRRGGQVAPSPSPAACAAAASSATRNERPWQAPPDRNTSRIAVRDRSETQEAALQTHDEQHLTDRNA
jgi:hypothetical protein